MRDPSGLVAALGRDAGEHAVPFAADAGIVRIGTRPAAAIDQAEVTVDDFDGARRWRRQIAAVEAGHAADAGGAALPAFDDLWAAWLVAIARGMGRILGVAIGIERPLDEILGETEPVGGAGMIDHDAVGLVRRGAQSAADHLAVKPHLLGRPRQDQAAERRHVPALGQHHAIADDLDLAGSEPRQRGVALVHRRRAVDVLGADAGGDEFVADVDRVTDAGGKADGLSAARRI